MIDSKIIKLIKYYLPVLLWAGVIFYFSSIPSLRYFQAAQPEIVLRKGAHFFEYAFLSFLLFRLMRKALGQSIWRSVFLSFIFVALYAASDEFHQTFVAGRTGRLEDVFYDIFSGLLILEVCFFLEERKYAFWKFILVGATVSALVYLEIDMLETAARQDSSPVEKLENSNGQIKESGYVQELPRDEKAENSDAPTESSGQKPESDVLPEEIAIKVPFTVQAPTANWDAVHEETCEEATLVMLHYYLTGKKLDPDSAEKEMQRIIKWENKNLGDFKDTNAEQNVEVFEAVYGKPAGKELRVIYDFGPEDIKKYLAKGEPVIVPTAGRELGNPNFTPPGPLYHNLVLTGYDGEKIITNDPGTRKGEGYEYDFHALYNAIHDFPGDVNNMDKGRKAMIVLE